MTPQAHRPDVSVVVTARNEARRLPELLAALAAQTLDDSRFEVVVVDDASTDDTAAVARRGGARVIGALSHRGLAAGRNLGIAAARAQIVALTDADCIPAPDWLELGVASFRRRRADILAGGIHVDTGRRPTVAALVDAAIHLDQARYVARGFGAGANLWLRRDLVLEQGGFDERIGTYGEEEELCQRAVAAGASLDYDPDVRVVHPARSSLRSLAAKGYGLGRGLAVHRRINRGTLGSYPRLYRSPRYYVPRRRMPGLERLDAPVGRFRELQMIVVLHTFVTVPKVAGDVVGEATAWLRARRRSPAAPVDRRDSRAQQTAPPRRRGRRTRAGTAADR